MRNYDAYNFFLNFVLHNCLILNTEFTSQKGIWRTFTSTANHAGDSQKQFCFLTISGTQKIKVTLLQKQLLNLRVLVVVKLHIHVACNVSSILTGDGVRRRVLQNKVSNSDPGAFFSDEWKQSANRLSTATHRPGDVSGGQLPSVFLLLLANLINCLDSNNSVIQTVCIDGRTCDARRRVPPRIRCLTHATERALPDFVTLFNISRTPLERYFLKHENVRYDVFQRKCIMLSVNK